MRTAILSIAALASGALAAPSWEGRGGNWGGNDGWSKGGDSWGSWSSSAAPSSSSVAVSPVTGTLSATHSPSAPGSMTFSFSKNATSITSTGSAPAHPTTTDYSTTYTTDIVTIYTTVCPATKTHVTGGSIATTTFITTSTVTSSYVSTITSKVTSTPEVGPTSSSSPVAPAPSSTIETTVTDVTTVYTTVCPVTATGVSKGSTLTSTYETTSTVTSVAKSTITLTKPVTSAPPEKSIPAPAPVSSSTVETTVTDVTTVYTTVCPATATSVSSGKTLTSTYQTTSTVTSVAKSTITLTKPVTVAPTPVSSTSTEEITVTDVTTIYTTVCPVTSTGKNGKTTTYQSTSTVTSVSPSTITLTATETATFVSTVQWGTTLLTYSVSEQISFPTSTATTFVGPDSYTKKVHTKTKVSGKPSGTGKPKPSGSVSTKKTATPSGSVSSKPVATGTGASSKPAMTGTGIKTSTATTSTWAHQPSKSCIPCEGQPGNDPLKWCGYTINDNSYKVRPKTCRTVEYDFVMTNTTFAPDGVSRIGLLVNGQMPGPKIEANWGDEIVVRVHNQLQDNGTAIHFHGQRQNYTNEMDGVPSITQCPLAPGQVQEYRFFADNYGSSWWHSHYALQIYSGVFGPMIIHGPASAEYDAEEFITLQDWNHIPLEELYDASQTVGNSPSNGPQTLDTGLINGMNVFGSSGSRYTMTVESGKTYRLRLLNSAVQTTFKFYLDGHTFQVIANDYVPITPYTTTIVNINPGQRYDVIFKADQPAGSYWLRADAQQTCTTLKNAKDIKGIVTYKGATVTTPLSLPYTYAEECVDEPLASLVPVQMMSAGAQEENVHETVLIGGNGGSPNLYKWTLSGSTFQSQYGDPSLVSIYNNGTVPDYSGNLAIEVPTLNEWVYVIIESPIPVPHPIHLHGHDFLILAQGYGSYSSDIALNTATPARRDSALLPGNRGQGGYLVVAFQADNPGAWLMHCHIGWHSAMGFALQIIEALDDIAATVQYPDALNGVCSSWAEYATETGLVVMDAGI